MERGVNRVVLLGNLGQDPEIRYFPSGDAVANISIATSESWTDKQSGEDREKTEWHRVEIHGRLAEVVGEYCRKGSQIYIEGKLETQKWQDDQGNDRYTTKVIVNGFNSRLQLLGGRPDDQEGQGGQNRSQGNNQRQGNNQGNYNRNQGNQGGQNRNQGNNQRNNQYNRQRG